MQNKEAGTRTKPKPYLYQVSRMIDQLVVIRHPCGAVTTISTKPRRGAVHIVVEADEGAVVEKTQIQAAAG